MGAYHTLEIEFHRAFRLTKTCWDAVYLERLETATDVAANVRLVWPQPCSLAANACGLRFS